MQCWGMRGRVLWRSVESGETICGLAAESLIMNHQKSGHKRGEERESPRPHVLVSTPDPGLEAAGAGAHHVAITQLLHGPELQTIASSLPG